MEGRAGTYDLPELEPIRKTVTIVFADLVGSTKLAARLDSDGKVRIANACTN